MQGITKSGFEYNIDERILTDWRFTTTAAKAESGTDVEKINAAQKIVELMFGEEQLGRLMDHIASQNDGYIPMQAISNITKEIIDEHKKLKN